MARPHSSQFQVLFPPEETLIYHLFILLIQISLKLVCTKQKFLDLISVVAPIGIFFGRIANFLNSELYGKETEIFWSVVFPKIDNLTRHPSQIYEALFEGLILFLILNLLAQKNMLDKKGIISSCFLVFY